MKGVIVDDVSRACNDGMHEWCQSAHCECACHYYDDPDDV